MCYWWLNSRYKKDRESDSAKLWELLRQTSVYREAWDYLKQRGPVFVDKNPLKIRTLKFSVGGSLKTTRKVIDFNSRGSSTFDDSKKLKAFVAKLKQPTDAISKYLNSKLTRTTRKQLVNFNASKSRSRVAMQESLIEFLKSIIHGPSIYGTQRFKNVALRMETRRMIRRMTRPRKGKKPKLKGEDLVRLNRLLLEDAYPSILGRGWGGPIWRLIREDFDPTKSWRDLSGKQQDIIQQELSHLDPQGKIHDPAKSGQFKCRMDFVSLRRKKGKQEEILWSSNHTMVQSKPDPEWFPVFCGEGLEEELYFSVFTFDERLGPTAIERKLKELWASSYLENTENSTESTKNITKFLNQLSDIYQTDMNHSEEVVASRLAVNPKDPYAAELQEDLRKKSLVPWAKRRRQIRTQMRKGQKDLKESLAKQREKYKLSPIGDWVWKRRIQLIPSVQSPLCQLWFPVGLTEEYVIKMFHQRFGLHKKQQEIMEGRPLRLAPTETDPPSIFYSPPIPFRRTTRQRADKAGELDFPWLGLTGRLVKEEEGRISKNSPIVKKLLKKNMAVDPEAINSAKRYVDRFMKQMDDHWRSQIVLR